MKQEADRKSVGAEFARYTIFNILGMTGLSCYILADTFFVSRGLGTNGLAALNLALPVYSVVHGCSLMLGMGGATKYAICKGQNDPERMDAVFMNTVYPAGSMFCAGRFVCFPADYHVLTGRCGSGGDDENIFTDDSVFFSGVSFE